MYAVEIFSQRLLTKVLNTIESTYSIVGRNHFFVRITPKMQYTRKRWSRVITTDETFQKVETTS